VSQLAFVFIGRPGSGKGTAAENLKQKHGFVHLCSSKIFERRKRVDPVFAARVRELSEVKDNGGLLPDEFVWTAISDEILLVPDGKNIVFDGCTRTAEQMRLLLNLLERLGFMVFIFLLDVVPDTCNNRMIARAKGAPVDEKRVDDKKEESRQRRLREFEDHISSIENYVSSCGRVIYVIDASQPELDIILDIENYAGLPTESLFVV
jgi:adenylate kinase